MSFGVIVPGQIPQINSQQIEECKWIIQVPNVTETVIIFLTGTVLIPPGKILSVYICPVYTTNNNPLVNEWRLLGNLTNARASAIFYIPPDYLLPTTACSVTIGFSVESETNHVESNSQPEAQYQVASKLSIAKRVALHLHRFITSHAKFISREQYSYLFNDNTGQDVAILPMNWLGRWKDKINAEMSKDMSFWKVSLD